MQGYKFHSIQGDRLIDFIKEKKRKEKRNYYAFHTCKTNGMYLSSCSEKSGKFGADGQGHSIYCSNQISFSLKNKPFCTF